MTLRQCDLTRLPLKRSLLGDPYDYDTLRIHKKNIEEQRPSKYGKNKSHTKIHSNKNQLVRKPSIFQKVDFEHNENLDLNPKTLITDQQHTNIERHYQHYQDQWTKQLTYFEKKKKGTQSLVGLQSKYRTKSDVQIHNLY